MSRRYLSLQEAMSALNRGKDIEAFLGAFDSKNNKCIRWVTFAKSEQGILAKVWEAIDEGSQDYLDIYSFSPANGEWDEPVKTAEAESFEEVSIELEIDNLKLVNYGVVQDEYLDFINKNT